MQPAKLAKNEQVRSSRLKHTIGLDSAPEGLFDERPKQAKETWEAKTSSAIASKVPSSQWLDKRHLWFKTKTAASGTLLDRESIINAIESKSSVLSAIIQDDASPILDSEGKTIGVVLVFNDMAMQR